MAESQSKLDDKTDQSKRLSTKIEQMVGAATKLKGEITTLQKELVEIARSQAKLDELRREEKEAYEKNRPEMEQGVKGVKMALKILKEYYAKPAFVQMQTASMGADGIISLLEVAESDFSKLLASIV